MSNPLRSKTEAVRRAHVLDAALTVFAARGFRGATIRDVARAAGVSDGTIYNVFANKAALLDALLARLAPDPDEAPPHPADRDLTAILEASFAQRWQSHGADVGEVLRVVLAEALVDPELREDFRERALAPTIAPLEALLKQNAATADEAALASRMIVASFVGAVVLRLLGDPVIAAQGARVPALMATMAAAAATPA